MKRKSFLVTALDRFDSVYFMWSTIWNGYLHTTKKIKDKTPFVPRKAIEIQIFYNYFATEDQTTYISIFDVICHKLSIVCLNKI